MNTILLILLMMQAGILIATNHAIIPLTSQSEVIQPDIAIRIPEQEECSICLQQLYDNEHSVIILPCHHTHTFHKTCLDDHVATRKDAATCPLCRNSLKNYRSNPPQQPLKQRNMQAYKTFFGGVAATSLVVTYLKLIGVL